MVSRAYLDQKQVSGPTRGKLFLDQAALPALIDAAAAAEGALERLASCARAAPLPMFGLALLIGATLGRLIGAARR
jgi:hypothetical protein